MPINIGLLPGALIFHCNERITPRASRIAPALFSFHSEPASEDHDEAQRARMYMPSIPIDEQANVPGGLMSFDPGTVPGKRPPNFGKQAYSRLPPIEEVMRLINEYDALAVKRD